MHLKAILLSASFFSSAFAIMFTSVPSSVAAGQTYTLGWSGSAGGPVTIILKTGPSTNLQTVATITSTGTGNSFSWTAPASYPPGTYAFQIQDASGVNYSGQFQYTGGSGTLPSASGSMSASASGSMGMPSSGMSTLTSMGAMSTPLSNSTTTKASTTHASTTSTKLSVTSNAPTAVASTPSTGGASTLSSPIALIMGAVAAMMYLH